MALKLKDLIILESWSKLATLPEGKLLINTVNAHSFNTAQKDDLFAEALSKGDVLIPDGASIVGACKWLKAKSRPTERIAGWDLFEYEMKKLNESVGETKTKTIKTPSDDGTKQVINLSAEEIDKKALVSSEAPSSPLASACSSENESQLSSSANQSVAPLSGDDESKEKKSFGKKEVFDLKKDSSSDGSLNPQPSTFNHKPKVMFMGSSNKVLAKIVEKAAEVYPNLEVVTYSPPYKPEFSDEDNAAIVKAINDADPDLLWIGMTAPKQEKWTYSHWQELNIHCHVGTVGAVFDFFAGTYQRAPQWWQEHSLEWLYRLVKEPKRMWRRYVLGNPLFVWNVVKEKMFG